MVPAPSPVYWIGAVRVFAALPFPAASVAGRSIPFWGNGYGVVIGLAGAALLVTGLLRRPVDAPIAVIVIAAVAAGLALVLLGAVSQYSGTLGWGWGIVAAGLGLALIGARSWAESAREGLSSTPPG
jgi:hypothetical protein